MLLPLLTHPLAFAEELHAVLEVDPGNETEAVDKTALFRDEANQYAICGSLTESCALHIEA